MFANITNLTLTNTLNTQRGLNSAKELSAMLVRRLGMLSLLVYMTLQTPVNSNKMPRYRKDDRAMPLYISATCGLSATVRISCWSLSADCSELSVN